MNAFHSIWSKPRSASSYRPEFFEISTAVLSALEWRAHNGKIFMVCDSPTADFLYSSKLDTAWDKIITSLDNIPSSINPQNYWAAGKIFALSQFDTPIAGIDTDFIVWKKLRLTQPLYVIHKENISPECYPALPAFREFSDWLDFSVKASNTAFFCINNSDFLKLYTNTAIDFMKYYQPAEPFLPSMLFAEQRLFSMCAARLRLSITELSSLNALFSKENGTFTHLWGYKEQLRKNPELNNIYISQCLKRISSDFSPEFYSLYEHLLKLRKSL